MAMWWTDPCSAFNSDFPFSHAECRSGRTPRASDGSTEASASLPARVGVVGPKRARLGWSNARRRYFWDDATASVVLTISGGRAAAGSPLRGDLTRASLDYDLSTMLGPPSILKSNGQNDLINRKPNMIISPTLRIARHTCPPEFNANSARESRHQVQSLIEVRRCRSAALPACRERRADFELRRARSSRKG